MKKLKILSLILAMLFIATTFASCGSEISKVSSLESVFNKNYSPAKDPFETAEALSDVQGYGYVSGNSYFAVFKNLNEVTAENPTLTAVYKVYSFADNAFVSTFNSTATVGYDIELFGDIPAFIVKATYVQGETIADVEAKTVYSLYDRKGKQVVSYDENVGSVFALCDMYVYNYIAYVENENGNLEKKMNIPEYLMINDISEYNDKYLYSISNDSIAIYNKKFEPVAAWTAPGYVEEVNFFVLNSGDVLVQYLKQLDSNAEKYDICLPGTMKYELTSLIVKAKSGAEKQLDLNYVIDSIVPNYALYDVDEKNGIYNNKFDNIARIMYIVEGSVDSSDAGTDIVIMSDNGNAEKSLKLLDGQLSSMPEFICKGVYYVPTVYGSALIDARGKIIQSINNDALSFYGNYIISERAVYNSDMEIVYDLYSNNAEVIDMLDSTLFITVKNKDDSSTIIALNGEEITTVCTVGVENAVSFTINADVGYYEIYNPITHEYKYFNSAGKVLAVTTSGLTVINSSSDGDSVLLSATFGTALSYYVFHR